jgi:hypothetical protein
MLFYLHLIPSASGAISTLFPPLVGGGGGVTRIEGEEPELLLLLDSEGEPLVVIDFLDFVLGVVVVVLLGLNLGGEGVTFSCFITVWK